MTRPRRAGASDRPRIAKVQHAPGTQESGTLWVRGARESRRHELRHHGATLWAWGARNGHGGKAPPQRDTPGARAHWPLLRERRPARRPPQRHRAHAVGPTSSATATRRPPQAPDVPPRARTTACYAFLQIGQLRGINPHQHQQEESYVPDFQFHRQR